MRRAITFLLILFLFFLTLYPLSPPLQLHLMLCLFTLSLLPNNLSTLPLPLPLYILYFLTTFLPSLSHTQLYLSGCK